MILSSIERSTLKNQITNMEKRLEENNESREGLLESVKEAQGEEDVYSSLWENSHNYVTRYEKELQGLDGTYIMEPFLFEDLTDHVDNDGRLYQGAISTDPKTIPQMVGENISPVKDIMNELDKLSPELDELIRVFVEGKESFSYATTQLFSAYTEGDPSFKADGPVTSGHWYVVGNSILHVVSVVNVPATPLIEAHCEGGVGFDELSCENDGGTWVDAVPAVGSHYIATIDEWFVDKSSPAGRNIRSWDGYSNTERIDKVATSTDQGLMDAMLETLAEYLGWWWTAISITYSGVANNAAPNMNLDDKNQTLEDHDYLENYMLSYPIHDGELGLDGLKTVIEARKLFVPLRAVTIAQAKEEYYTDRINFTRLRSNIQSGSLTRVRYMTNLLNDFPEGGTIEEKSGIDLIKNLLAR